MISTPASLRSDQWMPFSGIGGGLQLESMVGFPGIRKGKVLGRKRIILDREKIRTMHAGGESVRAIAAQVGISKSLVANILAKKAAS
jgi:hypothetical protein